MKRLNKHLRPLLLAFVIAAFLCVPAFAAGSASQGSTSGAGAGTGTTATSTTTGSGNVAAVVESTWKDAAGQIKTVVNSVLFPALDMILTIAFFGKAALCYFDYKKHGQFEWTGPVILFACLILTLTAPLYIWTIIGI